jgi:hypothetical protein
MTALVAPTVSHRVAGGPVRVPWATVLVLAVVLSYADGFWGVALRGAVGSIERTDAPFATWLRESTLLLPVYIFAVLAALTLTLRWRGPHPRRTLAVATTLPLVVAAATLAAIAVLIANAAYDYQLQTAHLGALHGVHGSCGPDCLQIQEQATLAVHVRGVAMAGALVLATNVVLVGLVVAFLGGRLAVTSTRPQGQHPVPFLRSVLPARWAAQAPRESPRPTRFHELRVFLAVAVLGTAVLHDTVTPYLLTDWPGARTVFGVLCAAEIVVAILVVARLRPVVLVAAVTVSGLPLLVWLLSRTVGLPFGPESGGVRSVGLVDGAAALLEVAAIVAAVLLLRAPGWLRPPSAAQHPGRLALVAVVAVTVVGLGGGISLSGPTAPDLDTGHPHGAATAAALD